MTSGGWNVVKLETNICSFVERQKKIRKTKSPPHIYIYIYIRWLYIYIYTWPMNPSQKDNDSVNWHQVDFAVPANHRMKMKGSEMPGKCMIIASESEKQWIMNVTAIPIVIGALGKVTKSLGKRLEEIKIETTALCGTMLVTVLYYGFGSVTR